MCNMCILYVHVWWCLFVSVCVCVSMLITKFVIVFHEVLHFHDSFAVPACCIFPYTQKSNTSVPLALPQDRLNKNMIYLKFAVPYPTVIWLTFGSFMGMPWIKGRLTPGTVNVTYQARKSYLVENVGLWFSPDVTSGLPFLIQLVFKFYPGAWRSKIHMSHDSRGKSTSSKGGKWIIIDTTLG